jgi:hypothetical protein
VCVPFCAPSFLPFHPHWKSRPQCSSSEPNDSGPKSENTGPYLECGSICPSQNPSSNGFHLFVAVIFPDNLCALKCFCKRLKLDCLPNRRSIFSAALENLFSIDSVLTCPIVLVITDSKGRHSVRIAPFLARNCASRRLNASKAL